MNETIELLLNHRSDRSFLDKDIPEDVLDNIIKAAYRAPTSVHSQQVSVIVTRDQKTREKITELSGGQKWIAQAPVFLTFVLDLYKTHRGLEFVREKQLVHTSIFYTCR
ncbi:nitroreductase family protein [Photorhabdus sp. P32]|uniref:nitroreductase family protein n=1 Tax=Photorhabdus sp. P32 TaxID=3117549 RepID=UPI00311AED74